MAQIRCKKIATLLILLITVFAGCRKDSPGNKKNETKKPDKFATGLIKASTGGTLETSDSIRMIIPAGALLNDATVSVGITGNEPKSVPNQNLSIVGKSFTISVPVTTLIIPISITIPKPADFGDTLQTALFAYNGDSYYPLSYTVNGDVLKISIDVLSWSTSSNSTQARSVVGEFIIMGVKMVLGLPADYELGLKKVSIANNNLSFSNPQGGENKKILLLVHGLMSSPSSCWTTFLKNFIRRSSSGYTDIWTYGYNTAKSIEENGFELSRALKANKAPIDIVAHSMGGLVGRTAIENGGCSEFVQHLVTLGTPHAGSPAALVNNFFGSIVASLAILVDKDLSDFYSYNSATQGVQDLLGSSAYINKIKNQRPPIPYYTIAASYPKLVPGNDDGFVTVTSATNVSGATSPNPIPISSWCPHTAMTDDPTVIETVAVYLNVYSPKPVDLSSFAGTYSGIASYSVNFPITYKSSIDVNVARSINDFKLFLFEVDKNGRINSVEFNQGYGDSYGNDWQYRYNFFWSSAQGQQISADGAFNFTRVMQGENHNYNFVQNFSGRINGNIMALTVQETGPCFNYTKNYVNGPGSSNPNAPNPSSPWSSGEYAGDFTRIFSSTYLVKQ